jgi:hypothetical protein
MFYGLNIVASRQHLTDTGIGHRESGRDLPFNQERNVCLSTFLKSWNEQRSDFAIIDMELYFSERPIKGEIMLHSAALLRPSPDCLYETRQIPSWKA